MNELTPASRVFALPELGGMLGHPLVASTLERALGLSELEATYRKLPRGLAGPDFVDYALDALGLRVVCSATDLERIPERGPLIVVANHPFGGIDGLLLLQLLRRRRHDVRVMANYMLDRIPELRELCFLVDPWGKPELRGRNAQSMRAALRHVRDGGVLAVFPAGEVAHFRADESRVAEPAWQASVGRLLLAARAPVLPVHFCGQNSAGFHLAGLVHPALRTALLPREMLNKRGKRVEVRVGQLSSRRALPERSPEQLMAYLRDRTSVLRLRKHTSGRPRPGTQRLQAAHAEPIADALDPELVAADLEALAASDVLVESAPFRVVLAKTEQIPNALLEIGRLRQIAFRAVGEGTQASRNLDRFDADYRHLVLWNVEKRELVGAYRIGFVDELMAKGGVNAIYTSTLFDLDPRFFEHVGASLDLGRSFVRPEYQGSPAPLLLLWKGIGRVALRYPKYRHLWGPCSISGTYETISRDLMVRFLEREHAADLSRHVRPRMPLPDTLPLARKYGSWVRDLRDLSSWVSHLEHDERGVPVLLHHYLRIGGRILGFNVDPSFHCVDGFVLVDLLQTPVRTLEMFMGSEGAKSFLAHHDELAAAPCDATATRA